MTPLQNRWFATLREHRAIAVIRAKDWQLGQKMAEVAITAGINLIEITWNSDRADYLIPYLKEKFPHCQIGTGTILDPDQLRAAIACGATFAFSPHSDPQLVTLAHEEFDVPMVLGAMTPTEIWQAWQWGSDGVKVFPIKAVGGQQFIQCLQPAFPAIPLIPTGGVTLAESQALIEAGAIAVGLSSDLFPRALLDQRHWQKLTLRLQNYHPFVGLRTTDPPLP